MDSKTPDPDNSFRIFKAGRWFRYDRNPTILVRTLGKHAVLPDKKILNEVRFVQAPEPFRGESLYVDLGGYYEYFPTTEERKRLES
jgi:hypothetical protein